MSTALPARPRHMHSSKSHIAIVASSYNEQFTDALLQNAIEELAIISPNTKLDVVRVPGAFEVPVACELLLANSPKPDAIIALGVIIQGQTKHAELVAESVTASLQEIALKHVKPVIHEVLLLQNEEQAHTRCIENDLNRGKEAARAAHTMLELFEKINKATAATF